MKIYSGGRQNGKTTKLIQHAAEHGLTIVVRNHRMVNVIKKQADKLGLKIPTPITYCALDNCKKGDDGLMHVVVNDAEWVLDALMWQKRVILHAATVTTDEQRTYFDDYRAAQKHESKSHVLSARDLFVHKFSVGDLLKFKDGYGGESAKEVWAIESLQDTSFTAVSWGLTMRMSFEYDVDAFQFARAVDNFDAPPKTPMIGFK